MADERARGLRRNPTPSEAQAWRILRQLRRRGVHVRRQHPVAGYIVDFAILTERVAIEFDGGVHRLHVDRDAERDAHLARLGWRTLRLPNSTAWNPDALITAVFDAMKR